MKNVEIIKYDDKDYIVDFDKFKIYCLTDNEFETYRAVLRKPDLSKYLIKPSEKFLKMLKRNSKTYDPKKHKFKGEQ